MLKNLTVTSEKQFKVNKRLVHKIVSGLKKGINFQVDFLQINFVSSSYILQLNNKYLGHNYTTDIITFNYSGENYKFDGEIFICVEEAENNSKKYNVSIDEELLRLIIHGLLHLKGFDDINKKDKIKMKKVENNLYFDYKFLLKRNNIIYDK